MNPAQNASVKGVVYATGSSFGNANVMCAYARVGNGKVAAIGDSSPTDDGTGDPNDVLYNGYTLDAAGNHQRLLMNITIWLARGGSSTTNIKENTLSNISIYPNPTSDNLTIDHNMINCTAQILDISGRLIKSVDLNEMSGSIDLKDVSAGLYFLNLVSEGQLMHSQKVIKQ
jgi:hypothetical protein